METLPSELLFVIFKIKIARLINKLINHKVLDRYYQWIAKVKQHEIISDYYAQFERVKLGCKVTIVKNQMRIFTHPLSMYEEDFDLYTQYQCLNKRYHNKYIKPYLIRQIKNFLLLLYHKCSYHRNTVYQWLKINISIWLNQDYKYDDIEVSIEMCKKEMDILIDLIKYA